ncbi:hypothetical protein HZA42_01950 [Candidatus Peregrinibacteria bacterium]|nr:hypothetical protein [Candidatus Peregrinibacteria bacterium]
MNTTEIPMLSDIEKGIDLAKPGTDLAIRLLISRMVEQPPGILKGSSPPDITGRFLIEPLSPEMARQMKLMRIAVDKVLGVTADTHKSDAGLQEAAAALCKELKENRVFSFEIIQSARGEEPQAQLTRIERNPRSSHSRVLLHNLNGARGNRNSEFVTWRRGFIHDAIHHHSRLAPYFMGASHAAKEPLKNYVS